jgi:uncharacterized protein with FMN-binding domain
LSAGATLVPKKKYYYIIYLLHTLMNIRKWILPIALVAVLAIYVVYKQFSATPEQTPVIGNNNGTSAPSETINPNSGGTSTGTNPSLAPATQTGFKDGQYTGNVASTVYGDVQVTAVINGGKITNIIGVKMPNSPGHTTEVTNMSFPILKSEAIVAQSAQVHVVSGATQTSEGFSQSLASALTKAS